MQRKREIKARFDNKMMNMIHPDDREQVRGCCVPDGKSGRTTDLEYQVQGTTRQLYLSNLRSEPEAYSGENPGPIFCSVVLDITAASAEGV